MKKAIRNNSYFKKLVDYKLLLFFLIFVLLYRLYYFNDFYVPNSDYFGFEGRALEWVNFELPSYYKRLPLYSWLIGIGHLISPNKYNATLYTAEIINLILSIVSLCLIYLISAKFLKKCAFLVVFLVALSPQSVFFACQPFLELLLLTTILLTIYFDIRGEYKRYFFAFLASITRYEGFLLIPILVLKDFIYSKRKLLAISLGLLASMGMILWLILSYFHSTDINPYVHSIMVRGMVGPKFILTCATASVFFNPPGYHLVKEAMVIISPLMIIGLYYFLKRSSKELFTILLFLISYIIMHMTATTGIIRYVYPVFWIFVLFAVGGVEYGLEYISNVIKRQNWSFNKKSVTNLFFVSCALIFSAMIFLITIYFFELLNEYFTFFIYLIYITCIGLFIYPIFREKNTKNLFFVSILILFFCAFVGFSVYNTQSYMDTSDYSSKYTKAQFRLVGEWYTQNAKPDDKLIMTEPWITVHYTNLSYDKHFVPLSDLNCDSPDQACFISELKKRNITYVVWDSHHGFAPDTGHCYNKYKVYLISDLSEGKSTEHFRLIKKLEIGSQTALIYKFVPLYSEFNCM